MGVRSSDSTPISFYVQCEGKSILGSNPAIIYGQEIASTLPGLSSLLSNFNGSILEAKAFVEMN